ncbi:competence type IV pilus minor pilin ComGD [Ornithinibacillus caprae]|nr:competence type IV pilus minor pilin ComGD [Ornithinibacillus caprae]
MKTVKHLSQINGIKGTPFGFTLIEVLMVLSIYSILLLLCTPIVLSVISNQQEKQFFETLQFDVLYLQNMSIGSDDYNRMVLDTEYYSIILGNTQEVRTTRKLPPGWSLEKRTLDFISFNANGSIRKAGTIAIHTKTDTYKIIFPIGKGRGYIEKE